MGNLRGLEGCVRDFMTMPLARAELIGQINVLVRGQRQVVAAAKYVIAELRLHTLTQNADHDVCRIALHCLSAANANS